MRKEVSDDDIKRQRQRQLKQGGHEHKRREEKKLEKERKGEKEMNGEKWRKIVKWEQGREGNLKRKIKANVVELSWHGQI